MLLCADDYFAAETILDSAFLRQAQKRLKAGLLAVGVPRRGLLMAIDGQQPLELLAAFAAGVSAQYHRGESAPITPAVFAVADGQVVGMLQGGEDAGDEVEEEEADSYVQGLVTQDQTTGLESVVICAGGESAAPLAKAIEDAFRETLRKHLARPEFGGEIRVVILTEMTPPEAREQLAPLEEHLQDTVRELGARTRSGRPVTVRFEQSEDGTGPA